MILATAAHLWLPFTPMSSFDPSARTFVRATGTHLIDARGHRTFDAISSVWTTIHGHSHPTIVEAIERQARTLDHATALGAANDVAEALAGELCAASGLDRAFFSSDGASAVEAALKMAIQYWQNLGEPQRTRFVHLRSSYHGDTVGAMSVSDIPLFRSRFGALCFATLDDATIDATLADPTVAAVIVEPLVQAAAGMRTLPPAAYAPLAGPRAPLLIVDEIATGFGRTGTLFAYEQTAMRPDIVCLGKGITGGTLALSATLTTARVYDAFLDDGSGEQRHFFHGHSYAANPIACAAARASYALFDREATLAKVEARSAQLTARLAMFAEHSHVRTVRQVGLMCGIELDEDTLPPAGSSRTKAWGIADRLYGRGHFTRPIGNVIQLVPPLCTTAGELDGFLDALAAELV